MRSKHNHLAWILLPPTLLPILLLLCALPSTASGFLIPWRSTNSNPSDNPSLSPNRVPRPHVRHKGTTLGGGAQKRVRSLNSTLSPQQSSPLDKPSYLHEGSPSNPQHKESMKRASNVSDIPDKWFISRAFQGESFFDNWGFATYPDPTRGQVNYISKDIAMSTNMSYVNSKGQAVMQVDNWSYLAPGQARNSIRIESNDIFNKGLFITDLAGAPWGCGVWPAWWTVGGNWPYDGEIDILEGVHDNIHNQVTFHTGTDCELITPSANTPAPFNFTGGVASTDCYGYGASKGCAVIDPSVASYGTEFNNLGGGVFAMLWLDESIRVWFFHRAAIPSDITEGQPKPSTWGKPTTYLGNGCDVPSHFVDHQLVFDITFCGDWAGNSYISSGCPGTCSDRIQDPRNFDNSTFTVNYVRVFGSPDIGGSKGSSGGSGRIASSSVSNVFVLLATCFITLKFLLD